MKTMKNKAAKRAQVYITLFMMVMILLASARTGYAFVPGESAVIVQTMWQIHGLEEKSKYEQYFQTLLQIKQHVQEFMHYRQVFDSAVVGNWKDPLRVLRDEKSRIIALGTDMRNMGWHIGSSGKDGVTRSPVMERAERAVEQLDRIVHDGEQPGAETLKDSLSDLYEVSNDTRTGARSEVALRDIAGTYTLMGQINSQLKEQYAIIDECYQQAQAGGLSQDQIQRLQVVSQTAQARAQGLQLQFSMQQARLQMNQLGLQVAATNQRDRENLDERANRMGAMSALKFMPGVPTVGAMSRRVDQ